MFTLTYIRRELRRRLGRTIMTVVGLALGVGLVAAITSISRGLDEAQQGVLDPLSSVGTDVMVTRPVAVGPGRGTGGGLAALSQDELSQLAQENAAFVTDFKKLGDPGEKFERDVFQAGTQLTFPDTEADAVASIDGVDTVSAGLVLAGIHQKGTIPKVEFEVEAGGETITREIEPPSPEEQKKIQECLAKRGGRAPECFEGRTDVFRTPRQLLRGFADAFSTDIQSEAFTIGGVDLRNADVGLLTAAQITDGRFFTGDERDAVVLSEAYARRKDIAVGDTLSLNDETFRVVGLASPPLGAQAADVYLSLPKLQAMADRKGRVNVLFVRAEDNGSVAAISADIGRTVDGATVTSAQQVASRVSGSLVDAASLSDRLGLILAIVSLVSAFLFASLLALSSVAKRVREIGTLKAIGWRKSWIVRQVIGESLAQGVLGGIIGAALGIGAALAIASMIPPLQASAAAAAGPIPFGLGGAGAASSDTVTVRALIDATTVLLAFGLALLGGLIAGAAGAWRAARMRPADALRQVG